MQLSLKIFVLIAAISFFSSCKKEVDEPELVYKMAITTVENPDSIANFYLRLDNSQKMWVSSTIFPNYKPISGQRIIAYFNIISESKSDSLYDYSIKLNDVYPVLTKEILNIKTTQQDSIGNDSIQIDDMWVGSDFLNVQFTYLANDQLHLINLVKDTAKVYTDGKVHLEFRHNSNFDLPAFYKSGIVSFNIKSLQNNIPANDSLKLVIHVNVPNLAADKTYDLTYQFSKSVTLSKLPILKSIGRPSHSFE